MQCMTVWPIVRRARWFLPACLSTCCYLNGPNVWDASVGTVVGQQSTNIMNLPVNLFGAVAMDTLINTTWGYTNLQTVALSFYCSDGFSCTNTLTEGQDIRDWLQSDYVNVFSSTNTVQVYSALPLISPSRLWGRIDKQHITLPPALASRTITNIVLTDTGTTGNGDSNYGLSIHAQRAFIYGLTATITLPVISIANHTNTVWLSWPASAAGFSLQTSTNLTSTNWMTFQGSPFVQGGQLTATNQITKAVQFFRLIQTP